MDSKGIDQLLGQMRAASQLAAGGANAQPAGVEGGEFAALLKASLAQVSESQAEAARLSSRARPTSTSKT